MTFDLQTFPQTFDQLHAILAAAIVLALILGMSLRRKAPAQADAQTPEPVPAAAPEPVVEESVQAPDPVDTNALLTQGSLHLLGLLQHHARLVDFLQEDLSGFSDADVGAAARVVHEGGSQMLKEYLTLESIHSSAEESAVTVPAGFDAAEIRLSGNIRGEAPFQGTLIHRGWRVSQSHLPLPVSGHNSQVLAPAEVEL